MEAKVSKYEDVLKEVKRVAVDIKSDGEEKREGEKRKRILDEQNELEKAKLEMRAKFEKSFKGTPGDSQNLNSPGAKLPKLVISKFEGTHLDWMRFWNQFETEIDKANLTQVAKFSYLKEYPVCACPWTDYPLQLKVMKGPRLYYKLSMASLARWQTRICNVLLDYF